MRDLVDHLERSGIKHPAVLAAIQKVPRDIFVEENFKDLAYADEALPIQCGQTISQPFVVAMMTEAVLMNHAPKKVLEIGTGSGYQAAILAQCVSEVYTVERYKHLSDIARDRFEQLGYHNIHLLYGDGFLGWEQHAPYDAILVTAAAESIPQPLLDQLSPDGGRLVMPVGEQYETQALVVVTRQGDEYDQRVIDSVVFVPLVRGVTDD